METCTKKNLLHFAQFSQNVCVFYRIWRCVLCLILPPAFWHIWQLSKFGKLDQLAAIQVGPLIDWLWPKMVARAAHWAQKGDAFFGQK